ncbi:MAG: hypothetical protein KGI70_02840 [Patescibacteria group bacterium]|nr:hypothetical protein [Patescibacteria group bacterium]
MLQRKGPFKLTTAKDVKALEKQGLARTVPMTRKQLLDHVAEHFLQLGDVVFKAPLQIEHMKLGELRAMKTEGHIFGEVEKALNTAGVATDGTMGSVMDPLGLTQNHAHAFCACHHPEVESGIAGMLFKAFSDRA